MAKPLLIVFRNPQARTISTEHVRKLAKELAPDNITPREPWISETFDDVMAVFQPASVVRTEHDGICVGHILEPAGNWWQIGSESPDGSYAIYRRDSDAIELVTDNLGARSIWYALTPDLFIASSSQRAIVACLKSFEPNPQAQSWMLSAGNLGLGHSWDRRIQLVPQESRLSLDRGTWTLCFQSIPCEVAPVDQTADEAQQALAQAIESALGRIESDLTPWLLLLTGGYDTRWLIWGLHNRKGIRALTWGLSRDPNRRLTDAWVAARLAQHYKVPHEFRPYDRPISESIDTVLTRFIDVGEGRVDNFAGYLDGMRLYKEFYEEGVQGLIRGEAAIGYYPVTQDREVRRLVEATIFSDYDDVNGFPVERFAAQSLNPLLLRGNHETREMWRDRLYQAFTLPIRFSALNELKAWYVEIMNPIITRGIESVARRTPDHLRTGRPLYQNAIIERSPRIPFASDVTVAARKIDFLQMPAYVAAIRSELNTPHARALLSDEFVNDLLVRMVTDDNERALAVRRLKKNLYRYIPKALIKRLHGKTSQLRPLRLNPNVLAFRAMIVSRMDRILREDAQRLG